MKSTIYISLIAIFLVFSVPYNAQFSNDDVLASVEENDKYEDENFVYNDQLIKLKMVINPMWEFTSAAVKIKMKKNNKFIRSAAPDDHGRFDLYLRYGEVYDFVVSQAGCLDKSFTVDTRYKGYYDSMVRQIFEIHLREQVEEEQIAEDFDFKLYKNQRGKLQLFFEDGM